MIQPSRPQPWIAMVLSLCCTGLGHLYCGRLLRGLVLFLVSLLILPVAAVVAGLASSTWALIGLLASFLGLLGLWLFAVVDAWRTAARGQDPSRHDYQRALVYALFVAVGVISPMLSVIYIRQNLMEAFFIPTESMSPLLHNGDRILVNKVHWRAQQAKRYDVVVFRAPDYPGRTYIKRIVGLPGENVLIEGDAVKVNGKLVDKPGAVPVQPQPDANQQPAKPAGEREMGLLIPPGMCYVLGDNRGNSRDSRDFGPVALGDVLGVAEYVYLPGDSWSRFGRLR
ncbi:MAG TPA: signal peptidase I [Planctomycetaceae bacterium]